MSLSGKPAAPLAALALCLCLPPAGASAGTIVGATVEHPVKFTVSPPLRDMQWQLPAAVQQIIRGRNLGAMQLAELENQLVAAGFFDKPEPKEPRDLIRHPMARAHPALVSDSRLQRSITTSPGTRAPVIATAANFEGIHNQNGFIPPDNDIAVGQNDVVEMTNNSFAVFDKAGNMLMGPVDNNTLWANFGGECETKNDGDPIVVYDRQAHRWLLSQFTSSRGGPYYECIAISATDDPTGSYYQYAFKTSDTVFADYPKFGVWPDGYYATFNDFSDSGTAGSTKDGVTIVAYDRAAMLNGDPNAGMQKVVVPGTDPGASSLLPADPDGGAPPPAGEPELFASYSSPNKGGADYALELWTMHVNWASPSNTVFSGPVPVPVPAFNDYVCGKSFDCVPQPDGAPGLDTLSDRLMHRLAYRNFGDHEAVAVNQTVSAGSNGLPPSGVRWYELTTSAPGAADWRLAQAGTWAPLDGNSRWMGSIAIDNDGDLMLGYSVSGPGRYPSIAVTGRLAGDPNNVMTLPEHTIVDGGGAQTSRGKRWGDYSTMVVDPSDDHTFWYVNEYYPTTSNDQWHTRIAAMRFSAGQSTDSGAIEGTVTRKDDGSPVKGAIVSIEPGDIRTLTNTAGQYHIALDPGTYTITPRKYPLSADESKEGSVTAGQTQTENFSLPLAAIVPLSGTVRDGGLDGSTHGWGLFASVRARHRHLAQDTPAATTYTAPATGRYTLELPKGYKYLVTATPSLGAYADGYDPALASATVAGPASLDFSLPVKPGCTAPGYGTDHHFFEDFDSGTFPPAGWTVVNNQSGSSVVWGTEDDFGKDVGNWTGGALHAAVIDGNAACQTRNACTAVDSSLISPPIAVTSLGGATELTYQSNSPKSSRTFTLGISTDGGQSWQTVLDSNATEGGAIRSLPGRAMHVDLSRYLPASGSFQLRWRYKASAEGSFFKDWYAQIDDVAIGTCHFRPGALVAGQVLDAAGDGVTGATVTDDRGNTATTYATGKNATLGDVYALFTAAGHRTLTATDGTRGAAVAAVDVADDHAGRRDLAFGTADVAVRQQAPASLPRDGLSTATTVTVTNHGPDPAPGVRLAVASSAYLRLESARPAQGRCRLAGGTGIECDLGKIPAGASVAVTVRAFGAYAGQAAITARAAGDNNDPAPDNNAATAQVTVKAAASPGSAGGGGGALGGIALAALLGLALGGGAMRRARRR